MSNYQFISTNILKIGYLQWLPEKINLNKVVILVHGWPDCPIGWNSVAEIMREAGYCVFAPALRGFGPTEFHSKKTMRSGQLTALSCDLLDFINALKLKNPILVGHDWGARAVANSCGLVSDIASHLIMLSVGYATNNLYQNLSLHQVRNYWYHWYFATEKGALHLKEDRESFARIMWDTWAPEGWYNESDFKNTLIAFNNLDWLDIVIHSYRHRWGFSKGDPFYNVQESILQVSPTIKIPTLILHGDVDRCNDPQTSDNKEKYFTNRYQRELLKGVGHFPHREAPEIVANKILKFID